MALGAEMVRPFPTAGGGGDDEASGWAAPVFLATGRDRAVDPAIWGDEKQMKRELVAWAKAVASMAAAKKNASSSAPSSPPRRVRP